MKPSMISHAASFLHLYVCHFQPVIFSSFFPRSQEGYGTALGVVGLYVVIQFLDNHLLIPRIVASKVKVNALVAIVGVLIGNAIGGVAGMFLALPTIAVLKIVFDRIPALKPWGLVLGDGEVSGTPGRKITPATAPVLEVKDNALLDEK